MTTKPTTIAYLIEQMGDAVTAKKMFGEYCLYRDGKVVALVCDDQLFLKATLAGRALLGDDVHEAPPYPGAKNALLVPGEHWDDGRWLGSLASVTARALPEPKDRSPAPQRKRVATAKRTTRS